MRLLVALGFLDVVSADPFCGEPVLVALKTAALMDYLHLIDCRFDCGVILWQSIRLTDSSRTRLEGVLNQESICFTVCNKILATSCLSSSRCLIGSGKRAAYFDRQLG